VKRTDQQQQQDDLEHAVVVRLAGEGEARPEGSKPFNCPDCGVLYFVSPKVPTLHPPAVMQFQFTCEKCGKKAGVGLA
jgi:predicted RNA-binding Zn-ribbon protein involved in translation (DUF1610 family)